MLKMTHTHPRLEQYLCARVAEPVVKPGLSTPFRLIFCVHLTTTKEHIDQESYVSDVDGFEMRPPVVMEA